MEAWQHLQPVVNRIIPIGFDQGLGALTLSERNVFLVWCYPAAINDGGHASFFYNYNGEHAHETVQALRDIGSADFGLILSRAIDLFPNRHVPRNIDERNGVFNALPESTHEIMSQLDEEFYDLDTRDVLLSRLLRFWNDHSA